MSDSSEISNKKTSPKEDMNLARHSRQLFPLILGNSRTAISMASSSRQLSTTNPSFSKEELDIKLDENPYYAKYADKIKKLKETNPEEYRTRLEAIKKASEKPQAKGASGDIASNSTPSASTPTGSPRARQPTRGHRKGLDAIMKTELLADKLSSEITELWKSYYKNKDAVYAVIPADTYKKLADRRKENPVFIYPLPRKDGYEMFLGQFSGDDCHFTSLSQYQKYQENAPVQLIINHYTELQESKGIVLMSGTPSDKGISVTDSQLLSYEMQYFYNEEKNYQIVKDFNESPTTFDYNRVIECINKDLLAQQTVTSKT